ncbi:hypothetical protein F511_24932 [Dorcoceras hygrometricum]|uniref:Uncharacterized protein n=1 Tax=Dorcoceras hygrometricum TaxID=472368 RepID=A0A2Z7CU30_9LAMI|nr:hypothetical protein F511_24932 [Dorcoceras hygrometricum]
MANQIKRHNVSRLTYENFPRGHPSQYCSHPCTLNSTIPPQEGIPRLTVLVHICYTLTGTLYPPPVAPPAGSKPRPAEKIGVIRRRDWNSSVLLVQADEGVSFLVVDRIGDIYRSLPRRADVIVTTVGARHKCQQDRKTKIGKIFEKSSAGGGPSRAPQRVRRHARWPRMAVGHEETTARKLLCDVGGRCAHERVHYGRDLRDCRTSPPGAWRRIAMEVGRYCAQVKRG